jgi:hypothetical protein
MTYVLYSIADLLRVFSRHKRNKYLSQTTSEFRMTSIMGSLRGFPLGRNAGWRTVYPAEKMLARSRRQGKLLVYLVLFLLSPNEDHLLLYVLHDSLDLCKPSKSKGSKMW